MPLVLALIAVALSANQAIAQSTFELASGSRVRIWLGPQSRAVEGHSPPQVLRGTIAATSVDSLTLTIHPAAAPLTVARLGVRRVDLSLGVPSRLESALRVGFAMAVLASVEFVLLDDFADEPQFNSPAKATAVGAVIGGVLGGVHGGLRPRERWRRLRNQ